jgi:hypothetical protein
MAGITRTDPGMTVTLTDGNTVLATVSDTGVRGRAGLVFRGSFDTATNYYASDAISYDGSSYIANKYIAASTTTPDLSSDWSTLAQEGIAGTNGVDGTDGASGVATQPTQPVGQSEGSLWYDTTTDRLKILRDTTYETVVTDDSILEGYDNITLNGGYF